jgi:phage/plasmid-associated DNA primase
VKTVEPPQGEGRRRSLHHRAEPPSPVCRFLAEQSVKDPHARVERKKLYEAYVNWLKEPGATAVLSRDQFYMQIRSMGFVERPWKGDVTSSVSGSRVRARRKGDGRG